MANTTDDIESICSTCGDVWHVVVAKVNGAVAKVQCKQCGKQRRYRGPGAATSRSRTSAKSSGTKKVAARGASVRLRDPQPLVEANMSRPPRPYNIGDLYETGDRVEHRKFGQGIVEELVGPTKVQVFFSTGRRILAQGLERPPTG